MKKRILSLILALSMVLSVLPLGAFAEGSTGELVIKYGYPIGTSGNGWSYDDITKTLTLTSGEYNFSYTYPQNPNATGSQFVPAVPFKIQLDGDAKITGGTFQNEVTNNYGTISHSTFESKVTNNNLISNCTFQNGCSVTNGGTINNGTFNNTGKVTNNSIISNGTFRNTGSVENWYTISGGTFQNGCSVKNYGTIKDNGTFNGTVENYGTINNGTFTNDVINDKAYDVISSSGTIENGTFMGDVINSFNGTIADGTFASGKTVTNNGTIKNGTFNGTVENCRSGTISGGTFAAGLSVKNGSVTGGVFNGDTALTGAHHVTVTNGSLSQVNGVDPRKADGTTDTAWDLYAYKGTTVTITASTNIYSLNDQPIGDGNCKSSYPDTSKKTTVKFTMPDDKDVVLGTGELVMAGGYPIGSNNGTNNCEGKGWEYIKKDQSDPTNTGKLILKSGTFDFSYTYPQNTTSKGAGAEPVACAVETQSGVEITGGTFNAIVYNGQNSPGGIISNGTFNGEVRNHAGTISGGKFEGTVINNVSGTISDGTFNKAVSNYMGTISDGTFNATVTNYSDGKISGGTFNGTVTNKGTIEKGTFKRRVTNDQRSIYGGTFAAGLSENHGYIYHGVFNGNTALTTKAHQVTVTNGSVLKVNDEAPRKEDGTEDTAGAWDLYAYEGTTMTIIASTEIFSLNGRLLGEEDHVNGNKNTVQFTMPDDMPDNENVVLNGAITCTELVMEGGWPKASNSGTDKGTISCSGTGWSYDSGTKTLTLTDGEYNFSSTEPVKCEILLDSENAKITGGTFEADVKNNNGGTISDGTFNGTVQNNGD